MRTFMMSTMMMAGAVALAVTAAACGGKSSPPAIANNSGGGGGGEPLAAAPSGPGFRDGALWSCQISDYDPQPCKLQKSADGWELRKLMGSQRFIGTLAPDGEALHFVGRFFCPWGACDAEMDTSFTPDGSGGFSGPFDGDEIRLRYDEALEAEYGGVGYGRLTGEEQ